MKHLRKCLKLNEPNSPLKPKELESLRGGDDGNICDCGSSCGGSSDPELLVNLMIGVLQDNNPSGYGNC